MEKNQIKAGSPPEELISNFKEKENNFPWWLVAVVVVLMVLGIWWWWNSQKAEETLIPGLTGIQGIVTGIDIENNNLVLEQERLIKKKDQNTIEKKTFFVSWDDNTNFFYYKDPRAITQNNPVQTGEKTLVLMANIIVKTANQKEVNVAAEEIHILPGSAAAKIVE